MDEVTKQKVMYSLIAFNITVVGYQFAFNSNPFAWAKLGLGLLAGVVVGGIVFAVMHFLSR